jgi:hypothetical protein
MKCYIDIENSKTQKVETLCVNIIKYEEDKNICPKCGSNNVMCENKNTFCHKQCQKRCCK